MKRIVALAATCILQCGLAQAVEPVKPAGTGDAIFIGASTKSGMLGAEISDYCSTKGGEYVSDEEFVLVIGEQMCQRSNYSQPTKFYKVAYRGDAFYVEAAKLDITDENKQKIAAVSDWAQIEKDGLGGSAFLRLQELESAQKDIASKSKHGIALLDWAVIDESDYTDGTGLRFEVYNPGKKTIKYIWFTVQAYNPVKDRVGGLRTLKGVGPIEPDSSGSYRFEYVWFTDLAQNAVIKQIKLQFMDGTLKTLTNIEALFLKDETVSLMNE